MRVMVFGKVNKEMEAGKLPTKQAWEEMEKYNDELAKAGIVLDGGGLQQGVLVRFSGMDHIVTDGPFAESKELIAGYQIWQVKSMEEAIAWVKRSPMDKNSEVEIRPIFMYSAEEVGEIMSQDK